MTETPVHIEARWARASRLVAEAHDIIAERPGEAAPSWARARGWVDFLSTLSPSDLERCEVDGLAEHAARLSAPSDLRSLAEEARAVCALPALVAPGAVDAARRVNRRKRQQLAAFAALVTRRPLAVDRVVDVGAGHGHLTRHLAEALQVDAVGLEIDPDRVATARALAGARFETVDLFAQTPDLGPTDLVVGLHACGALTDRLVQCVARAGSSVAFVSCCLQKRPEAARAPLVPDGPAPEAIARPVLGLGNIATAAHGVEASQRANLAARARRAALHILLVERGLDLAPGDEMHGLNRRRAHAPFATLAEHALRLRGLSPATAAELTRAEAAGQARTARIRRWSVARRLLGRVLEVQINLDRALFLHRAGHRVEIGQLWPPAVSPRNIAVLGAPAKASSHQGSSRAFSRA